MRTKRDKIFDNKFDEIESKRKISKDTLEKIFTDNIPNIRGVKSLDKSNVSWFKIQKNAVFRVLNNQF